MTVSRMIIVFVVYDRVLKKTTTLHIIGKLENEKKLRPIIIYIKYCVN